jgi:hypothetical protein
MAARVAARKRDNSFRDKLGRYTERDRQDADLRRKAVTALTAEMARLIHAVIKGGAEYLLFFERPVPGGTTSLCTDRGARKRPSRKCLALAPEVYLVLRTVRTTAMSAGSCVC